MGARMMQGEAMSNQGPATYSSLTKLPKDMPPQLTPPMRLSASDSLRFLLTLSQFWLFMVMGLGPALTKESCRPWSMAEASRAPVGMLARSSSEKPEGILQFSDDDEASSRLGVSMAIDGAKPELFVGPRKEISGGVAGWGEGDCVSDAVELMREAGESA